MTSANKKTFQSSSIAENEAEHLLKMPKQQENQTARYPFPTHGGKVEIPLVSLDRRENFIFHVNRKRIVLSTTYQTRTKSSIVLARLDFDAPHLNPDGRKVGVPHLHYYREGYGDRWATDQISFLKGSETTKEIIDAFFEHCNIVGKINLDLDLFS